MGEVTVSEVTVGVVTVGPGCTPRPPAGGPHPSPQPIPASLRGSSLGSPSDLQGKCTYTHTVDNQCTYTFDNFRVRSHSTYSSELSSSTGTWKDKFDFSNGFYVTRGRILRYVRSVQCSGYIRAATWWRKAAAAHNKEVAVVIGTSLILKGKIHGCSQQDK